MEQNYAFIKDNKVVNIVVFDSPDENLLNHFITELDLDNVVLANDKTVIDGDYDGTYFWTLPPFASWVKGEQDWQAPVAMPQDDKVYDWHEESLSWVERPCPHPSWSKVGNDWQAPIPMPTDGKLYFWKEDIGAWEEAIFPV
jgi:hypothetical protein